MNKSTRLSYKMPTIEQIKLDNEISLALQSTQPAPPSGPFEVKAPDFFNNDPYTKLG